MHTSANPEDNQAALQAGCDEILPKPVLLKALTPIIRMIYQRHAAPQRPLITHSANETGEEMKCGSMKCVSEACA